MPAFLLNLCIYAAKDSLSFFWISMKWLTDIWMSKLQIFKRSKSFISSQFLSALSASDISVHSKPFDFACANFVLLLLVKPETVSISLNQSSNCEESLPLNIVISWSRMFTKDVIFCAVHKVSVYSWRTSSRGSCSADGQSVRVNLFSLYSRWLIACVGQVSLASTLCCK